MHFKGSAVRLGVVESLMIILLRIYGQVWLGLFWKSVSIWRNYRQEHSAIFWLTMATL